MATEIREQLGHLTARTMRTALLALGRRRSLGRVASRAPGSRRVVSRFVAGERLEDVIIELDRLQSEGYRTTVDILGESVTNADEAARAADQYVELLDALASGGLDRNVSLKLTQLGLDLGHVECVANLGRVLDRAATVGGFVRVDMEDHARTASTLEAWRQVRSRCPSSGVVIQAALRRSPADIDALIDEEAPVRLCKGAYRESPTVALQDRHDVDRAYDELAAKLLRSGIPLALATHDEARIDHAVTIALSESIGRDQFEFQMLYGVRRDLQERLVADGWHVRVYVPYGLEWYAYFMRRLAERPANIGFVVRNVLREAEGSRRRVDS